MKNTMKKIKGKVTAGDVSVRKIVPQKKVINKKPKKATLGVVYISHIPHGFYEDEIKSYFSQFGVVTRVKVARSRRTGRSKGYAFVEFKESQVAEIAAETMNNYLMWNRLLKCRYIPPEEQKSKLYVRTIRSGVCPRLSKQQRDMENKNKILDEAKEKSVQDKLKKKIEDFKRFFEERGIEFNFKVNEGNAYESNNENNNSSENIITNGTNEEESEESDTSLESDYEDETDDQFGVLEIDESDDEIQFKTPPQVKKVIKRSSTSALITPQAKKLKAQSQSLIKINDNLLLNNERKAVKPKKKNLLLKINNETKQPSNDFESRKTTTKKNGLQSQLNGFAEKIKATAKSSGIGQKFQKKLQNKEKTKLSKPFKAKLKQKKQNANINALKKGVSTFLEKDSKVRINKASSPEEKKAKKLTFSGTSVLKSKNSTALQTPENGTKKRKTLGEAYKGKALKVSEVVSKVKKSKMDDQQNLLSATKKRKEQRQGNLSKVIAKKFGVKNPTISKQKKTASEKSKLVF